MSVDKDYHYFEYREELKRFNGTNKIKQYNLIYKVGMVINESKQEISFMTVSNVCREIGWLLSFVYTFGRVAHQCC
jgi:hypothetical protein